MLCSVVTTEQQHKRKRTFFSTTVLLCQCSVVLFEQHIVFFQLKYSIMESDSQLVGLTSWKFISRGAEDSFLYFPSVQSLYCCCEPINLRVNIWLVLLVQEMFSQAISLIQDFVSVILQTSRASPLAVAKCSVHHLSIRSSLCTYHRIVVLQKQTYNI